MLVLKNGKICNLKEDDVNVSAIHEHSGIKCGVHFSNKGICYYNIDTDEDMGIHYPTLGELISNNLLAGFTPYINDMQMSKSELNGEEL